MLLAGNVIRLTESIWDSLLLVTSGEISTRVFFAKNGGELCWKISATGKFGQNNAPFQQLIEEKSSAPGKLG